MIIGEFLLHISAKYNAANITEFFEKSHRKFTNFGPQKLGKKIQLNSYFMAKAVFFFKEIIILCSTKKLTSYRFGTR